MWDDDEDGEDDGADEPDLEAELWHLAWEIFGLSRNSRG
jgi:hypothetical protein